MPNADVFNSVVFNGSASTATLTSHALVKYQLVAVASGSITRFLPSFRNASITERINAPWLLTFDYPQSEAGASNLVFPNEVWVYDDREQIVNKFKIRGVSEIRSGEGTSIHVEAESRFRQLADELVVDYEAAAVDAKTVKTIIQDLLNSNQVNTAPIRIGYIHPFVSSLQKNVHFQGENLFGALMKLRDTVDEDNPRGDMEVTPAGYLNWKPILGDNKGQTIRYKHNLKGITKKTDPARLFTRLYAYGEGGGPGNRLTLVDAGEANEYIDSNTGTYGIIPKQVVFKSISDATNLLNAARAVLDKFDDPFVTYDVDVAALEMADPDKWEFNRLRVGSQVRVIDETLSITALVKVVEIQRSLDNPLQIQVQLANKVPEISDVVSALNERLETLENAENSTPLSDTEPPAVGTGTAGTSNEAARADHTHDASIAGLSDDTPLAVAETGSAGVGTEASRDDHVHPFDGTAIIDELTETISENDGANRAYLCRLFVAASLTALNNLKAHAGTPPVIFRQGDLGFITDEHIPLAWLGNESDHGTPGDWEPITYKDVDALPAIPTNFARTVLWTDTGAGDGDDQLWIAHPDDTKYKPTTTLTDLDGTP